MQGRNNAVFKRTQVLQRFWIWKKVGRAYGSAFVQTVARPPNRMRNRTYGGRPSRSGPKPLSNIVSDMLLATRSSRSHDKSSTCIPYRSALRPARSPPPNVPPLPRTPPPALVRPAASDVPLGGPHPAKIKKDYCMTLSSVQYIRSLLVVLRAGLLASVPTRPLHRRIIHLGLDLRPGLLIGPAPALPASVAV
jgi:hypothetical protein